MNSDYYGSAEQHSEPQGAVWDGSPKCAVFFVTLEHPMGLPEGLSTTVLRPHEPVPWSGVTEGRNFVFIRIWRRPEPLNWQLHTYDMAFAVMDQLVKTDSTNLESEESTKETSVKFGRVPRPNGGTKLGTVVELVSPLILPASGSVEEAFSDTFDRCISELNRFMRAYQIVSSDLRVTPITRQTCPFMVPMTTQDTTGNYSSVRMFMAHTGVAQLPYGTEELTDEERHNLRVLYHQVVSGYPFIPFFERFRAARRDYIVDGDYASTVVSAYTACEVLLNTVLLMMAWEERKTREETRAWFEGRLQFMARVSREIQPRLGGSWATPPETGPTPQLQQLSDVRQRVVHLGYLPSEPEAQAAIHVVEIFEEFIKDRLAVKRHIFPRTCLMLNGEPGLRRRNAWDSRMERWVDENAGTEDEWGVSFRRWRDMPPMS
jgi:hypothetical protein